MIYSYLSNYLSYVINKDNGSFTVKDTLFHMSKLKTDEIPNQ